MTLSPLPYSPGPPGEYADRNHRLQQAYGTRWHLGQIQETEGRVRGVSMTWPCGKWYREGGLRPRLETQDSKMQLTGAP